MVLGFGELTDEWAPPEEIWLDDEALAEHFDRVKARSDDKAEGYEVIPDMEQNEMVKGLLKR